MAQPKVIAIIRPLAALAGVEVRLVPEETVVMGEAGIDFEQTPYIAIQETRTADGVPVLVITEHRAE